MMSQCFVVAIQSRLGRSTRASCSSPVWVSDCVNLSCNNHTLLSLATCAWHLPAHLVFITVVRRHLLLLLLLLACAPASHIHVVNGL